MSSTDYKFDRILIRCLLIALLVLIVSKVFFIFTPLIIFVKTVIVPLVVSGVLFYILSPVKNLMVNKFRINKVVSIFIIYIFMFLVILSGYFILFPVVKEQVFHLTSDVPSIVSSLKENIYIMEEEGKIHLVTDYISIDDIYKKVEAFINREIVSYSKNFVIYITKVSSFIIYMIVVPFMLYYMLKDGDKLLDSFIKFVKKPYREETKRVMIEMNNQLKTYVTGQIIVYSIIGVLILIGYNIIGIEYALLLAVIFVVLNCIPVAGVFLAATPAVVVGLLDSPVMAIKVLVLVTIVYQTDSHFLSPQIMGKKLNIHPLTIILLMLVSGTLFGVLGLIFALPVYVLLKVLFTNIYMLHLLSQEGKGSKQGDLEEKEESIENEVVEVNGKEKGDIVGFKD